MNGRVDERAVGRMPISSRKEAKGRERRDGKYGRMGCNQRADIQHTKQKMLMTLMKEWLLYRSKTEVHHKYLWWHFVWCRMQRILQMQCCCQPQTLQSGSCWWRSPLTVWLSHNTCNNHHELWSSHTTCKCDNYCKLLTSHSTCENHHRLLTSHSTCDN